MTNRKQGEVGDMVQEMEALHKKIHDNIEEANRKYKQKVDKYIRHKETINEGDLV